MELITSCVSLSEVRNQEFLLAQKINSQCESIEKIHVLTEDLSVVSWLNLPKVHIHLCPKRPTFRMLVEYANSLGDNKVVIISNADIAFDKSLEKVKFQSSNIAYCLTRWYPDYNSSIDSYNTWDWEYSRFSFDSWILKTPIYKVKNLEYTMGKLGCDQRFSYELWDAGYKTINPSKIIKTLHVHSSNQRSYTEAERLTGNYLGIDIGDSLDYNEDYVITGWCEGGDGFFPRLWKWVEDIEDVEFWGREDIPDEIKSFVVIRKATGKVRKRPLDMEKAKEDWKREFKRRCEEDPRFDEKGNWIG